ncbi:YggT family protein [Sporosarcina sp. PTS2304]|uniref:YggT family protein n=1 Tax=Sporosarcina sp. PTS2304 TaxID=2283194 RepID=UPI000E0CFE25|nr:YggT family protein [Sporosarcina sp. PTS2304]AXH98635.1 YggT family protein [Sporosarcina sp. PTS2304]
MDALLFNIVLFIRNAVQIYSFLLIIYILMSWFPSTRETKFGQLLGRVTEPYLGFFRKFIPPLGMIDISPIAALFALQLINRGIVQIYFMIRGVL